MALMLECPGCGRRIEWSASNPFRPFCSGRCKDADLIGWANEKNAIRDDAAEDNYPVDPDA